VTDLRGYTGADIIKHGHVLLVPNPHRLPGFATGAHVEAGIDVRVGEQTAVVGKGHGRFACPDISDTDTPECTPFDGYLCRLDDQRTAA